MYCTVHTNSFYFGARSRKEVFAHDKLVYNLLHKTLCNTPVNFLIWEYIMILNGVEKLT